MGLGGGFFMNIYIKNESKAYTLDARDMSAGAATEEFYADKNQDFGQYAITVPGELKGYWEAHKRFGGLPWKDLVQPTIDLCHRGFEMSKHQYDSIHFLNKWKKVDTDPELKRMFIDEKTGQIRSQGAIIRPKVICKTYERIAEVGGDDLYNGELAEMFAEDLKEMGSIVTKEDLAAYHVHWYDSVPVEINNYTLFLTPPPSSGFLIGFIMNILKGYHFGPEDLANVPGTILTYHRMIEAFKYAYAKRTLISDPAFKNMTEVMPNIF
jgi:gamma-glutamyltranspeptidase/glutathione hydrolase/leukotriene-C4 hydrolase